MSGYSDCLAVGPDCPVEGSIYGYYPSLGANSFFLTFFALAGIINAVLGYRYKTWTYAAFMCLACVTETVGYVGRILLNNNPYGQTGFIMQICCLIMGPAFNSGAIYLTLKYIVLTFGAEWSRIKPALYTWVFIIGDLIALVLQAVGGAMASTADEDAQALKNGDNIAMAGIVWQVVTLFTFGVTAADYIIRRARSSTPLSASASRTIQQTRFRVFAAGVVLAWLTVFTRCVYRIAEFAQGWGNPIMNNQTLFIILESVMIVIATFCQTAPHPGYCFPALSKGNRAAFADEPKVLGSSESSRSASRERKTMQQHGSQNSITDSV